MKKGLDQLNVRVMYDHIITTMNVTLMTPGGVIITDKEKGEIKTRQTVLACGPNSGVSVGEEVEINISKFPTRTKEPKNGIGPSIVISIPPIEIINGREYLFISSREVKYAYVNTDNITTT